jgi:site-specific recombinase XerD
MNLVDARDLWLAELSTNGASRWTLRNYKGATDEAFTAITDRRGTQPDQVDITTVDRDDVVAAMAAYAETVDPTTGVVRRRAQSTLATYSTALRSFFAWCVETEKIDRNPMARVKRPKAPVRVPKAMDAAQCRKLLEAAGTSRTKERDTLMLLMGLTMGLRLAELAGARPSDFHPSTDSATHLRIIGKGNKERLVPVPGVVRTALAAWLPVRTAQLARRGVGATTLFLSQRLGADGTLDAGRHTVAETYDKLLTVAGLKQKGRRVHVARHSFATLLLEAGTDIVALSELLGHSSIAVTNVYVKSNPERMMAAVEANPLAHPDDSPSS